MNFSLVELYVMEGLLQKRLNFVRNTKEFTNSRQQKQYEEEKIFIDSSLLKIRDLIFKCENEL